MSCSAHMRRKPFTRATPLGFEPRITPPKSAALLGRCRRVAILLLFRGSECHRHQADIVAQSTLEDRHHQQHLLAYLFRSPKTTQAVILLGAGASFRSGIPLADEAVKRIACASYAWSVLGRDEEHCNPLPSDWMPYRQGQQWFISDEGRFAENFPLAIE